jgi:hypothetical protein
VLSAECGRCADAQPPPLLGPQLINPHIKPTPRGTPGLLTTLGYAAIFGAAGLVYLVADDSTGSVAAQVVGAAVLGGAGVAALVGAGLLADLQKID